MKRSSFFIVLLLIAHLCTIAQNVDNKSFVLRLGKIALYHAAGQKTPLPKITLADLKANNTLIIEGSCKVEEFSFSVLPKGRDFIGPYTVKGSAEFSGAIKDVISSLGNTGGRVFIENIKVNCGGVVRTVAPILFTYQ